MSSTTSTESTPGSTVVPEATAAEVRAWAKEQGKEVGDRGRVSATLVAEFNAARVGRPDLDVTQSSAPSNPDLAGLSG